MALGSAYVVTVTASSFTICPARMLVTAAEAFPPFAVALAFTWAVYFCAWLTLASLSHRSCRLFIVGPGGPGGVTAPWPRAAGAEASAKASKSRERYFIFQE